MARILRLMLDRRRRAGAVGGVTVTDATGPGASTGGSLGLLLTLTQA